MDHLVERSHFCSFIKPDAAQRGALIRLVLTDIDGVWTDGGVWYGPGGEFAKRFQIKDGMGVERLRDLCGIETGIVTGELSPSVAQRAKKLKITELHLGVKDKLGLVTSVLEKRGLSWQELAYIGDDVNDLEVLKRAGLAACPEDALPQLWEHCHVRTRRLGGQGAFRDLCEFLITCRNSSI